MLSQDKGTHGVFRSWRAHAPQLLEGSRAAWLQEDLNESKKSKTVVEEKHHRQSQWREAEKCERWAALDNDLWNEMSDRWMPCLHNPRHCLQDRFCMYLSVAVLCIISRNWFPGNKVGEIQKGSRKGARSHPDLFSCCLVLHTIPALFLPGMGSKKQDTGGFKWK